VLPVIDDGRVVYAQLRVVEPGPDGPRYLNPRSDLAANPRIARIRPVEVAHPEVIVTEGIIDGLSAASAGYRAVAVLSATLGDEAVAAHLAKLPWPVVLGFDGDEAGQAGASRLGTLLATRGRPSVTLDNPSGDLNDALQHSADWPTELAGRVAATRGTTHLAIGGR
jgi:DNA primase